MYTFGKMTLPSLSDLILLTREFTSRGDLDQRFKQNIPINEFFITRAIYWWNMDKLDMYLNFPKPKLEQLK